MLTAIKLYALLSLLCGAAWAFTGWRWSKRQDAIRAEYRWWSSRVIEHEVPELPPIIRTWQ